jgi:hypothetical protein
LRYSLIILFSLLLGQSYAQEMTKADSINLGLKYLLEDRRTRFETTDVINAMYNFKYDVADQEFRYLQAKYPDHPLPSYLLGLVEWWKIVPNPEDLSHDAAFLARMDETIAKSEKLLERNDKNLEAAFFLAGAYGFRGRLHADRKNWRKATFDGKAALKYLGRSHGQEQFSPEFLFGDALFNYYREYIADNYGYLKPILMFFPKGSKVLGLQQLETVTRTAFYTRTEAQTYLMRIYANEENKPEKGYEMAKYLHGTFPDNAYFHRYYARCSYVTGRTSECKLASQEIYDRVKAAMPGYENESMRNASYFLGYITMNHAVDTTAKRTAISYFSETLAAAETVNAKESGYTLYALYYSATLEDQLGHKAAATKLMQQLEEQAPKDHNARKDARTWLDKNKVKKKGWWIF